MTQKVITEAQKRDLRIAAITAFMASQDMGWFWMFEPRGDVWVCEKDLLNGYHERETVTRPDSNGYGGGKHIRETWNSQSPTVPGLIPQVPYSVPSSTTSNDYEEAFAKITKTIDDALEPWTIIPSNFEIANNFTGPVKDAIPHICYHPGGLNTKMLSELDALEKPRADSLKGVLVDRLGQFLQSRKRVILNLGSLIIDLSTYSQTEYRFWENAATAIPKVVTGFTDTFNEITANRGKEITSNYITAIEIALNVVKVGSTWTSLLTDAWVGFSKYSSSSDTLDGYSAVSKGAKVVGQGTDALISLLNGHPPIKLDPQVNFYSALDEFVQSLDDYNQEITSTEKDISKSIKNDILLLRSYDPITGWATDVTGEPGEQAQALTSEDTQAEIKWDSS
ncbi:MAG: hypothetical protein LBR21_02675, partial [Propionibacteriaceae bacterium]|nr:hypothetical protein [Propionibacteriaceae bacterium]